MWLFGLGVDLKKYVESRLKTKIEKTSFYSLSSPHPRQTQYQCTSSIICQFLIIMNFINVFFSPWQMIIYQICDLHFGYYDYGVSALRYSIFNVISWLSCIVKSVFTLAFILIYILFL